MATAQLQRMQDAYVEVAEACNLGDSTRAKPWAVAGDWELLRRVLPATPGDAQILDFGCCGYPWITNYLHREGYNITGIDVDKPHWYDHQLPTELGLPLVSYDGQRVPFKDNSFDVILMFGVLEHIGVWKSESQAGASGRDVMDEKYQEPNRKISKFRREVLREVHRVLHPEGTLYVTKFPNRYGRDKLYGGHKRDGGHLNSERTRPDKFRDLLSEDFEVEYLFANGLLPHRIPIDVDSWTMPSAYASLDHWLSNLPVMRDIAQSYAAVAHPK